MNTALLKSTVVYSNEEHFRQVCKHADHPYIHACVLVTSAGNEVASLCIYKNEFLQTGNEAALLIGNISCPDDQTVFDMLTAHCTAIAGSLGVCNIVGPMNGSTWDDYRLPLSEVRAFLGDIAAPPYYKQLFSNAGFNTIHTYYSSQAHLSAETVKDIQPAVLPAGDITIRTIDMTVFEQELRVIYPLCMAAFAQNPYFSPISEQEFLSKYLPYSSVMDAGFVLVAVQHRHIIAFVFCYPDTTDENNRKLIIKTIARHPQHRIPGLIKEMVNTVYGRAFREGYTEIIHAFMHKNNPSFTLSGYYNGQIIREYALYKKQVDIHGSL